MITVCEPLIFVSGNHEPLITPTKHYFASVSLLTTLSPWCWGYLVVCVLKLWYCEFSLLVVINLGVSHDSSGLVCIASTEISFKLRMLFMSFIHQGAQDEVKILTITSWAAQNQHSSSSYPISSWAGYHNYWVGYLQPLAHGIGKSHQCNSEAGV